MSILDVVLLSMILTVAHLMRTQEASLLRREAVCRKPAPSNVETAWHSLEGTPNLKRGHSWAPVFLYVHRYIYIYSCTYTCICTIYVHTHPIQNPHDGVVWGRMKRQESPAESDVTTPCQNSSGQTLFQGLGHEAASPKYILWSLRMGYYLIVCLIRICYSMACYCMAYYSMNIVWCTMIWYDMKR